MRWRTAAAASWAGPAGEAGAQAAAGLGSTWRQYLLLLLAAAASQRKLDLAAVIVVPVIAGEAGGLGG